MEDSRHNLHSREYRTPVQSPVQSQLADDQTFFAGMAGTSSQTGLVTDYSDNSESDIVVSDLVYGSGICL